MQPSPTLTCAVVENAQVTSDWTILVKEVCDRAQLCATIARLGLPLFAALVDVLTRTYEINQI